MTTHENVGSQVAALVEAWEWRPSDRLLLVLPLHHVHGIINGLGSALAVRATCEILPAFDADTVWARLSSGEITVFTAVPTIYSRLIAAWDAAPALQAARSAGVRRLRLMMSGSAALPVHVLERWREISGHTLLERYGMTEIGMALSNPLHGERRPGCVGQPLPDVDVHLVDEDGIEVPEGTPGELEVRGPAVFHEYWQRAGRDRGGVPQRLVPHRRHGRARETDRTGCSAAPAWTSSRPAASRCRRSKSRRCCAPIPAVAECAVVGVLDAEWGERVSAAVELRPGASLSLDDLQRWAKTILAPYKVPRALAPVDALPRNAMGKVVKPQVARLFE